MNTSAISRAIANCAEKGGGRVCIPEGLWLTGAIHLRSRVELHLDAGAEVRFSQDPDDYLPVVFMQRGGIRCYNYSPFIYARGCRDIAITGEGVFNGQGQSWWPWKHDQPGMEDLFEAGAQGRPVDKRVYGTPEDGVRPPFLQPLECRSVLIEGVTFRNSPSWTVHPVWCENIWVRRVNIENPVTAHNTDGINADACRNVLIEDCEIDTGDDGICMKAGRDEDAWDVGIPCENILIRHCRIKAGHGGVVVGSEMSAGVRNALVHDCDFDGTDRGIRIKTKNGRGGYIKNLQFERISMREIRDEAIIISFFYAGEKLDIKREEIKNVPEVRNIVMKDIDCSSAGSAVNLAGIPGYPMEGITLENINIIAGEGMTVSSVKGLTIRGAKINHTSPKEQ